MRTRRTGRDAGADPAHDVAWRRPTWEEVVTDHSARVYRLALRLTGNPHDAEDLTQDVFVRVFRSLDRFKPGTLEGWLHRITTNLYLDGARRRQRIRFDRMAENADDRLPGSERTPSQLVDDHDLDHDVAAALDALAPEFRAAVVLCDIEGLSYEEIADVLGVKLGTVRSRIHRGRAQLRAALAHRRPDAGGRYKGIGVEDGSRLNGADHGRRGDDHGAGTEGAAVADGWAGDNGRVDSGRVDSGMGERR